MRLLLVIVYFLMCGGYPAFAFDFFEKAKDKKQNQSIIQNLRQNNEKQLSQSNQGNKTNYFQKKVEKTAQYQGGKGGYFAFDKNEYEKSKAKSPESVTARRRFGFVNDKNYNPNAYGSMVYLNNNALQKQKIKNQSVFDMQKYVSPTTSIGFDAKLTSSTQGVKNSTLMPFNKSYDIGIVMANRLSFKYRPKGIKTLLSKRNLNKREEMLQSKKEIGFDNKIPLPRQSLLDKIFNKIERDYVFIEYGLRYTSNKYFIPSSIANSASVDKQFSGLFLSTRILYMPKAFELNLKLYKNLSLPINFYLAPEIGFGQFSYKNTFRYDTTLDTISGKSISQTVTTKSAMLPVYGLGLGTMFDISPITKTSQPILLRAEIKYLTTGSMSITGEDFNRSFNESVKYSAININVGFVIKM